MAAPARPDHTAQQAMRAFLTAARILSEQLGQELRRESGMSQIHYEVLAHLADSPGSRLRMRELARRTGVSGSRLSHLVDRLEERAWVTRLADPHDGRVHHAHLTDAGQHSLAEAAPWHDACARSRLLDHLTDEQLGHLKDISDVLLRQLAPQHP